jgi:hypothetical protein
MDCKATVKIGDFSRGGQTRGDDQALDHDLGCKEKYTPCGIVDEDILHAAIDETFLCVRRATGNKEMFDASPMTCTAVKD